MILLIGYKSACILKVLNILLCGLRKWHYLLTLKMGILLNVYVCDMYVISNGINRNARGIIEIKRIYMNSF